MRTACTRSIACLTLIAGAWAPPSPAAAQTGDYFAGKTLRVIVGLEAGGSADVFVRSFSAQLRKHIPGNPTVVVQNMTGAGGSVAANYTYERAAPDGLTIVFNTFHPLAQALGDPSMRARYDQFDYVGGIGDIRVNYMRADVVPGGAKKPADVMKADTVMVGALSNSDFSGTLGQLSLKVLGVKYKPVVGYRGGSDIFLAMQRGEVHFHNTSIGTFRTRSGAFIKSGEGLGISYLVPVDASGNYQRSKLRHRDAGLSRPLQGDPRQAARRQGLGGLQLAHQPGRRVGLHCARRAQSAARCA